MSHVIRADVKDKNVNIAGLTDRDILGKFELSI